jgi:hypothetical protein
MVLQRVDNVYDLEWAPGVTVRRGAAARRGGAVEVRVRPGRHAAGRVRGVPPRPVRPALRASPRRCSSPASCCPPRALPEVLAPVQRARRQRRHRRDRTHGVHPARPPARRGDRAPLRRRRRPAVAAPSPSLSGSEPGPMERELLIEIGCEELPASWLPSLTAQLGERLAAGCREFRLDADGPVETFSHAAPAHGARARIAERQTDLEETITGPPVSAAFTPDGQPTPAALGFARKHGVEVAGPRQRSRRRRAPTWRSEAAAREDGRRRAARPARRHAARPLAFPKHMRGTRGSTTAAASSRSAGRSAGCCSSTAAASCRSRSGGRRSPASSACRRSGRARSPTGTAS